MAEEEISALELALGLQIEGRRADYSLNAFLETLDQINPSGLENVEPLQKTIPPIQTS